MGDVQSKTVQRAEELCLRLLDRSRTVARALAARDADILATALPEQEALLQELVPILSTGGFQPSDHLREITEELRALNSVTAEILRDELEAARFLLRAYTGPDQGVYTAAGQVEDGGRAVVINAVG
jgi:hypothetical protein